MTLMICVKLVMTDDGLFVLPIALAFHWTQGSLGVIYYGFTGREVLAIYDSDWRPMVMIALGCCLALAVGSGWADARKKAPDPNDAAPGIRVLVRPARHRLRRRPCSSEGTLSAIAPDYPSLRQIITTFDAARLGVLFLILRRLCAPPPRFGLVGAGRRD